MGKQLHRAFLVATLATFAQAHAGYVKSWERLYSGETRAVWQKVALDSGDAIYVAGSSGNTKGTWWTVKKYMPNGDAEWEDIPFATSTKQDVAHDLVMAPGDVLYAVGRADGEFTVTRYNTVNGDVEWSVSLGHGTGRAITLVPGGGVYVTGQISGGWANARISESGNIDWQQSFNGPGDDYGSDIVASANYVFSVGRLTNNPKPLARTVSLHPETGGMRWISPALLGFQDATPGNLIIGPDNSVISQTLIPFSVMYNMIHTRRVDKDGQNASEFNPIHRTMGANLARYKDLVVVGYGTADLVVGTWLPFNNITVAFYNYDLSVEDPSSNASPPALAVDSLPTVHMAIRKGSILHFQCGRPFPPGVDTFDPALNADLDAPNDPDTPNHMLIDSNDDLIVVGTSGEQAMLMKVHQTPTACKDFSRSEPGVTVQGNALANDLGYKGGSVSLHATAAGGTFTLAPNGDYTFVPNTDFAGSTGAYYKITKGSEVAIGFIDMMVNPRFTGFSINPTAIIGGLSFTATASFGSVAGHNFSLELSDNSGSIELPSYVLIPPYTTTLTFKGKTLAVSSTVTRQVTAKIGAQSRTASVTLKPGLLTGLTLTPNLLIGGDTGTGIIQLANPSAASQIVQINDNSTAITAPAGFTLQAGVSQQSFTYATSPVSSSVVRSLTVVQGGELKKTATLTLTPPPILASLSMNPISVKGGQTSLATVTLSAKAGQQAVQVALSDNSGSIDTPASCTVLSGNLTGGVTLSTYPVYSTVTRQLTATLGSVSKTANLTLTP